MTNAVTPIDLRADVAARSESGDWEGAGPDHLVDLFAEMHAHVHKVPVALAGRELASAVRAARRMLAEQFGGNANEAVRFIKWTWERESTKRERTPSPDPMGWRRQFSASLVTDYRVAKARKGESVPESSEDVRPVIIVDTDEARVADEAVAKALARDPSIYQQGNRLVRVVSAPPNKRAKVTRDAAPVMRTLTPPNVREAIARNARLVKADKDGELAAAHVPEWLPRMIAERGQWEDVRRLEAIAETPFLRPDGTVATAPGWDAETEVLVASGLEPIALPDAPTQEDACAALEELAEVFADFPLSGGRLHVAALLAALLGKFARYSYEGPTPALAVDATASGSGKGLIVRVISRIATGREPAIMTPSGAPDEMRKRLFALVCEGEREVCIDNIAATIDDPALDALITAPVLKDRILGVTGMAEAPNHLQVAVTGNNLAFGGDFARRMLHVRIAPPVEDPETRTDFAHPDLVAWVAAERPRLVRAALVALRAHAVARPKVTLLGWGSFEGWSRVVRSTLVWCGWPDPAATRAEVKGSSDSEKTRLGNLLRAWRGVFDDRGSTCADAVAMIASKTQQPTSHTMALAEAIDAFCPAPASGKDPSAPRVPSARSLGNHIRGVRERVVGGLAFAEAGSTRAGAIWTARPVGPCDSGDSGDSVFIAERKVRGKSEKVEGPKTESLDTPESQAPSRPLRPRSEVGRSLPTPEEEDDALPF